MLVYDLDLRDKLGNAAKVLFENCYTWEIRASKIINLFLVK